jgi:hypothetical protein
MRPRHISSNNRSIESDSPSSPEVESLAIAKSNLRPHQCEASSTNSALFGSELAMMKVELASSSDSDSETEGGYSKYETLREVI